MRSLLRALRRQALTVGLALVCSAGLSSCTRQIGTGPKGVNKWLNADGTFRAELLITERHDELERDWMDDVAQGDYPAVVTVDRIQRGQKVYVVLVFTNCIEVRDNDCSMTVDYSVTKPDGTEYGSIVDRSLWSGEPPTRNLVFLGGPYMSFEAEPGDPEGQYRITAVVRGASGAISVAITRPLVVSGEPN